MLYCWQTRFCCLPSESVEFCYGGQVTWIPASVVKAWLGFVRIGLLEYYSYGCPVLVHNWIPNMFSKVFLFFLARTPTSPITGDLWDIHSAHSPPHPHTPCTYFLPGPVESYPIDIQLSIWPKTERAPINSLSGALSVYSSLLWSSLPWKFQPPWQSWITICFLYPMCLLFSVWATALC